MSAFPQPRFNADQPQPLLVDVSPVESLRAALALAGRIGATPGHHRAVLRRYENGHALIKVQGLSRTHLHDAVLSAAGATAVQVRIVSDDAPVESPAVSRTPPVSPTVTRPRMEAELERVVRAALEDESFGVLVMVDDEHVHTATVLFAESPDWKLVIASRPATRKGRMSAAGVRSAFHVDTRNAVFGDRHGFTRIGFEGRLRRLPRGGQVYEMYRRIYVQKLAIGKFLLNEPGISLYLFEPETMRVAIGSRPPVDISLREA